MKRFLSLVLAMMMVLGLLPAMAESTNPYEVDETLVGEFTWWTFFDQAPFLKAEFEKKYPNVKIDL